MPTRVAVEMTSVWKEEMCIRDRHTAAALTTDVSEIEEGQGGDIVIFERHIGIVSDRRNKNGVPYICLLYTSRLDFSGSWLVAAYGGEMDAQTLRSQLGVSTLSYLLQNGLFAVLLAPVINMFPALRCV